MIETSMSLLEQLRTDPASEQWNRLVDLYQPLLSNWLRSHDDLSPSDRDDLLQDVLLVVAQELPQFEHNRRPGAFRCWLRRIVVHRMKNFWRDRNREPQAVGGSDFLRRLAELEDDASAASRLWDRQHDRLVMGRLLESVRPRFAENTWHAFRKQVIEDRPPEEVAENLGMPVNSVYVAKSRVLLALRQAADGLLA